MTTLKKIYKKIKLKSFHRVFYHILYKTSQKEILCFLIPLNLLLKVSYQYNIGNLHSLYNISKDLAYTLNSTN